MRTCVTKNPLYMFDIEQQIQTIRHQPDAHHKQVLITCNYNCLNPTIYNYYLALRTASRAWKSRQRFAGARFGKLSGSPSQSSNVMAATAPGKWGM